MSCGVSFLSATVFSMAARWNSGILVTDCSVH